MPGKPLTAKRQAFCREYIKDYNGTRAGIDAGYSPKTAQEQASRLLCNVMVLQEITRLEAEKRQINVATRKQRQQFWTDTYRTAPNMADRLRASELLGKSEADFITVTRDITEMPTSMTPEQAELYAAMAEAALKDKVSGPTLRKETA